MKASSNQNPNLNAEGAVHCVKHKKTAIMTFAPVIGGRPACLLFPRSQYAALRPLHLGIKLHARSPTLHTTIAARRDSRLGVVRAQAASSSSEPAPSQRHAFLHDFCLCIPYGALIAAGGLVMMLFGVGQAARFMAGAGVAEVVLSALSLKAWRARQPAAVLFTGAEAGVAGAVAYNAYQALQRGAPAVLHGVLCALSAAMALFLVYNVLAGGNPPPKAKAAE